MAMNPLQTLASTAPDGSDQPTSDAMLRRMEQALTCAQALAQATLAWPDASRFLVVMPTAQAVPIAPGVRFASWAEVAETVEQDGAFIATSDLLRLVAACTARLDARDQDARIRKAPNEF